MNCGQRCQLNFLEQLPIVFVCGLIAGIQYPKYTFLLDVAYCISRLVYAFGYMAHPDKRVVGAIAQDIVVLAMIVLAYKTAFSLAF